MPTLLESFIMSSQGKYWEMEVKIRTARKQRKPLILWTPQTLSPQETMLELLCLNIYLYQIVCCSTISWWEVWIVFVDMFSSFGKSSTCGFHKKGDRDCVIWKLKCIQLLFCFSITLFARWSCEAGIATTWVMTSIFFHNKWGIKVKYKKSIL